MFAGVPASTQERQCILALLLTPSTKKQPIRADATKSTAAVAGMRRLMTAGHKMAQNRWTKPWTLSYNLHGRLHGSADCWWHHCVRRQQCCHVSACKRRHAYQSPLVLALPHCTYHDSQHHDTWPGVYMPPFLPFLPAAWLTAARSTCTAPRTAWPAPSTTRQRACCGPPVPPRPQPTP